MYKSFARNIPRNINTIKKTEIANENLKEDLKINSNSSKFINTDQQINFKDTKSFKNNNENSNKEKSKIKDSTEFKPLNFKSDVKMNQNDFKQNNFDFNNKKKTFTKEKDNEEFDPFGYETKNSKNFDRKKSEYSMNNNNSKKEYFNKMDYNKKSNFDNKSYERNNDFKEYKKDRQTVNIYDKKEENKRGNNSYSNKYDNNDRSPQNQNRFSNNEKYNRNDNDNFKSKSFNGGYKNNNGFNQNNKRNNSYDNKFNRNNNENSNENNNSKFQKNENSNDNRMNFKNNKNSRNNDVNDNENDKNNSFSRRERKAKNDNFVPDNFNPLEKNELKSKNDSNTIVNNNENTKLKSNENETKVDNTTFSKFDNLYGYHVIKAALIANKRKIEELHLLNSYKDSPNERVNIILGLAKKYNVKISYLPRDKLDRFTNGKPHNGMVLKAEKIKYKIVNNVESAIRLQKEFNIILNKEEKLKQNNCVLLLDQIVDPQNFASILRTALFMGVDAILVSNANRPVLNSALSKTSSGALEICQLFVLKNSTKALNHLKSKNEWKIVGINVEENEDIQIISKVDTENIQASNEEKDNEEKNDVNLENNIEAKKLNFKEIEFNKNVLLVVSSKSKELFTNKVNEKLPIEFEALIPTAKKEKSELRKEVNDDILPLIDSLSVGTSVGIVLHDLICKLK